MKTDHYPESIRLLKVHIVNRLFNDPAHEWEIINRRENRCPLIIWTVIVPRRVQINGVLRWYCLSSSGRIITRMHRKHVEPCQIILRRAIWSVRSISFNRDRNDENIFDVKSQFSMLSSRKPELDFRVMTRVTILHSTFFLFVVLRQTLRASEVMNIYIFSRPPCTIGQIRNSLKNHELRVMNA